MNAMDTAQKVARSSPHEDAREDNRNEDDFRKPKEQGKHGDRGCPGDVRDLPRHLRSETTPESNLDSYEQTALRKGGDKNSDWSDVHQAKDQRNGRSPIRSSLSVTKPS